MNRNADLAPAVSTPGEYASLLDAVLGCCCSESCEGCPILCAVNDYECAAYLAKLASGVDWEGYEADESGMPAKNVA